MQPDDRNKNDVRERFVLHFNYEQPSGITDNGNQQSTIRLYPNPARNLVYVSTAAEGDLKVDVVDMNGKTVIATAIANNQAIDISNLPAAVYQIKITTANATLVKRLVKE